MQSTTEADDLRTGGANRALVERDEPLTSLVTPSLPWQSGGGTAKSIVFTLLLFVAGLSSMVLTPPFQNADEMAHMVRAYSLSEGNFKGRLVVRTIGLDVPLFVARDGCAFNHLPFRAGVQTSRSEWGLKYDQSRLWTEAKLEADRRFVPCQFACYPPIPHAPQAAAMKLGRSLEVRTFTAMYIGRLANLMTSCAVLFVAFWMLSAWPRLQLMAFLFAGMPMCVFLFSSMSADALTIALSLLVLAWSVRLGASYSTAGFAGFVAACVLLSLCKSAYVLIPFAAVPMLLARRESWRSRLIRVGLLAACVAIPAGIWMWFVRDLSNYVSSLCNAAETDVAGQFAFLRANPLAVLNDWITYTHRELKGMLIMMVGSIGWGEATVSKGFAITYVVSLFAVAGVVAKGERRSIQVRQILMNLAIVAGSVFMLYLVAYLAFGTKNLSMMAGRYFLPLVPLVLTCVPGVLRLSPKGFASWRIAVILFWVVMMTWAQFTLATRYWATAS